VFHPFDSHATVGSPTCCEITVLFQNLQCASIAVHGLIVELQDDDLESRAPLRYAIVDHLHLTGQKLVNELSNRFDRALADPFGIATLPFFPFGVFGRFAITNLVLF
jgi:hypothetical protein